jgi:predicted MFS family arabinose efflux permease
MLLPWSFSAILVFYSVNGLAQAMIWPMTNALVGDNVALEKRPGALGRVDREKIRIHRDIFEKLVAA